MVPTIQNINIASIAVLLRLLQRGEIIPAITINNNRQANAQQLHQLFHLILRNEGYRQGKIRGQHHTNNGTTPIV